MPKLDGMEVEEENEWMDTETSWMMRFRKEKRSEEKLK